MPRTGPQRVKCDEGLMTFTEQDAIHETLSEDNRQTRALILETLEASVKGPRPTPCLC